MPENEEAKGFATRLDRTGNGKVHETTKMIPKIVFEEEIRRLKPAPTLSTPVLPRIADVRPTNVVHFKQNRYAVPKGTYMPGRKARVEVDSENNTVSFFDAKTGELLASHNVCLGKGQGVGLPKNSERFKETKYDELKTKVLSAFEGVEDAAAYIGRIIEKYPRYARDQLTIISRTQKLYVKDELQNAISYCVQRELYSANDFRDTLEYFRGEEPRETLKNDVDLPTKYSVVIAQIRNLNVYNVAAGGGVNVES